MFNHSPPAKKQTFKAAKLFRYSIAFQTPLSFKGIKLFAREGLILQLQHNQQFTFAEIAPLPGFSKETLQQAQTQTIKLLCNELNQDGDLYPSVHFALDCILQNIPITQSSKQQTQTCLLQGDNSAVLTQYKQLNKPNLIKLKVARQTIKEDIMLFNALTSMNPNVLIRCDANQAWKKDQAIEFFTGINTQSIDYIEEPTTSAQHNLQLAKYFNIQLALDETLQQPDFVYEHHDCYKALVLKPTLIGSLARLQYFINIAKRYHLQVSISSSFESPVALQQLKYLASHWSQEVQVSTGLDTLKFFKPSPLDKSTAMIEQIQKLECVWQSQ
jgi:O-succinylbenzoate synthase